MRNPIKWININLPFGPVFDGRFSNELDSFSKRKLNKSGVLIKIETGEEFLIGDINQNRGICDDCCEFDNSMKVIKYAIIFKNRKVTSMLLKR